MNSEQVLQGESLQAIKFSNKLLNKLSKSGVGKKWDFTRCKTSRGRRRMGNKQIERVVKGKIGKRRMKVGIIFVEFRFDFGAVAGAGKS